MANPKPIMDVSHPNKSAPSGNSKSVIVTHRPMMQDPMVTPEAPAATKVEVTTPGKSGKSKLQPLTAPVLSTSHTKKEEPALLAPIPDLTPDAPDAPAEPEIKAETKAEPLADTETAPAEPAKHVKLNLQPLTMTAPEAPVEPTPAPEAKTTPEDTMDKATDNAAGKDDADGAAKKQGADITDPTNMDANDVEAEQAKQDAQMQKLMDTKKYFLPINTLEKRRTKRVIVFGILLAVVLAIAWADIALDAGLITIDGVKPLTNFFSV